MGKTHRGKGLFSTPAHGRGSCPTCGRTRIKLLYSGTNGGEQVKVCKNCRNKTFAAK